VKVGQAHGWIEGGKLTKPEAPLGSVERLNEDLRATQAPCVSGRRVSVGGAERAAPRVYRGAHESGC
jgi:hypothetical protein